MVNGDIKLRECPCPKCGVPSGLYAVTYWAKEGDDRARVSSIDWYCSNATCRACWRTAVSEAGVVDYAHPQMVT